MADVQNPDLQEPGTEAELQQEPQRPDWLPDKFKSPEAFVESYTNLEREFTTRNQRIGELEETVEQLMEQQQQQYAQQQPAADPTGHPLVAAYARAMEDGDYANAALIQAQIAMEVQAAQQAQQPQPEEDLGPVTEMAEMAMRRKWGDNYDALEAAATEILQANPHIVPDGTLAGVKQGLDTALRLAHAEQLAQEHQTLAEQQAKAEEGRQRKLAAQTASGSGPRPAPPDEQKAAWEQIVKAGGNRFSTS